MSVDSCFAIHNCYYGIKTVKVKQSAKNNCFYGKKTTYNYVMESKKRFGGWQGVPKKSLSGRGTSPVYRIAMSPELLAKCKRNGPDWVRAALEAAAEKEPTIDCSPR